MLRNETRNGQANSMANMHVNQINIVFKNDNSVLLGFLGGSVVKNLPVNAGDMGSIPCLGRSYIPRSN